MRLCAGMQLHVVIYMRNQNMLVVKSTEHSIVHAVMMLFSSMRDIIKLESNTAMSKTLLEAGFPQEVIEDAICWLRSVSDCKNTIMAPSKQHCRVYDGFECDILGPDIIAKLFCLEAEQILDFHSREMVIDHLLALDCQEVDEQLVLWVTLIVLYYSNKDSKALLSLENAVLLDSTQGVMQ
jgi:uncharacterized protein Smg (DUF494 family)